MQGYGHSAYPASLSDFGTPRVLPRTPNEGTKQRFLYTQTCVGAEVEPTHLVRECLEREPIPGNFLTKARSLFQWRYLAIYEMLKASAAMLTYLVSLDSGSLIRSGEIRREA